MVLLEANMCERKILMHCREDVGFLCKETILVLVEC